MTQKEANRYALDRLRELGLLEQFKLRKEQLRLEFRKQKLPDSNERAFSQALQEIMPPPETALATATISDEEAARIAKEELRESAGTNFDAAAAVEFVLTWGPVVGCCPFPRLDLITEDPPSPAAMSYLESYLTAPGLFATCIAGLLGKLDGSLVTDQINEDLGIGVDTGDEQVAVCGDALDSP